MISLFNSKPLLALVLCVVWVCFLAGCSRVMSPPSRSLFGKEEASDIEMYFAEQTARKRAPGESYGYDVVNENSEAAPKHDRPSAMAQTQDMPTNPLQSRQETLNDQFAQSWRVPEKVPPRLIPIEPIQFPGDSPSAVIKASGVEEPSGAQASRAIAFSDMDSPVAPTAQPPEKPSVQPDVATSSPPTASMKSGDQTSPKTSALPGDHVFKSDQPADVTAVDETAMVNPSADHIQRSAAPATGVHTSEITQPSKSLNYDRPNPDKSLASSLKFDPLEFAAARRKTADNVQEKDLGSLSSQTKEIRNESIACESQASDPADDSANGKETSNDTRQICTDGSNRDSAFSDEALQAAGIKVDQTAFDRPDSLATKNSNVPVKQADSDAMGTTSIPDASLENQSSFAPIDPANGNDNQSDDFSFKMPDLPITEQPNNDPRIVVAPPSMGNLFEPKPRETPSSAFPLTNSKVGAESPTLGLWMDLIPEATCSKLAVADSNSDLPPVRLEMTSPQPMSKEAQPAALIASEFPLLPPQTAAHESAEPEEAGLQLVNCQFCTEIKGFGQVTPFASTKFTNNQRTLVYCEVENYESVTQTTSEGIQFVTRFCGKYQILDAGGAVVQAGQFPEIEDITNRRRRDFYLYFPVTLKSLPAGNYQLKLSIEDSTNVSEGSPGSSKLATQNLLFSVGAN